MQGAGAMIGDDVGRGALSRRGLRFWSSRRVKDPLESVLRCLGRGLSCTTEVMEDAAVDAVEDVESLRSRNPKESSEAAEDVMDGAIGDIPSFAPLYGVSTL